MVFHKGARGRNRGKSHIDEQEITIKNYVYSESIHLTPASA